MRKNFKRKNYVLFGAIGIAAVALSSVGFATWITGMQNDKAKSDIQISVDTATNETMYLDVELGDANINVTEQVSQAGGKLYNNSTAPTDLKFSFSKFRLIYSNAYSDKNPLVTMSVSITKNETQVSSISYSLGKIKSTGKASYLNFPTTFIDEESGNVVLNNASEADKIEGYTVKTLSNKEISLNWGDLFGKVSPTQYYNNRIDNIPASGDPIKAKLEIMSEATSTLNTMSGELNGTKMTLTFTASWDGK